MGNSYHERFQLYLESLYNLNESSRETLVEFVENQLPDFIRSTGLDISDDIYSCIEADFWESVDADLLPTNTEDERKYASMVMTALKYFKGFIRFNKSADYKKLFSDKVKRERRKLANAINAVTDHCEPEAENESRKEGEVSQVSVTHYERSSENRKKALLKYGYECQVCHMNFEEVYGEIGKNYIEVHHLYPVCNMGEDYQFDPLDPERGLIPLCSNCHSMIHRGGKYIEQDGERVMQPMTLQELQELYNKINHS